MEPPWDAACSGVLCQHGRIDLTLPLLCCHALPLQLGVFEAVLREEPSVRSCLRQHASWGAVAGVEGWDMQPDWYTRNPWNQLRPSYLGVPGKQSYAGEWVPTSLVQKKQVAITTAQTSTLTNIHPYVSNQRLTSPTQMPATYLQGGLVYLQRARKCSSITMAERFQVGLLWLGCLPKSDMQAMQLWADDLAWSPPNTASCRAPPSPVQCYVREQEKLARKSKEGDASAILDVTSWAEFHVRCSSSSPTLSGPSTLAQA